MAIADGGMLQGEGEALGARRWKRSIWKRERKSATELSSPGICLAVKVKLCTRVSMVIAQTKSMTLGNLERLELMTVTTGRLSHQMQTRLPDHWEPQIKQATYIAKSSCQSMLIPVAGLMQCWGSQWLWNHWPLRYPPLPRDPEASVNSWRSEEERPVFPKKKLAPFQWSRKVSHMEMSLRNSALSLTCHLELEMPFVKLIIRCRKARPGTTALQANWSVPIKDWSSLRVANFLLDHCCRASLALVSLSRGGGLPFCWNLGEYP